MGAGSTTHAPTSAITVAVTAQLGNPVAAATTNAMTAHSSRRYPTRVAAATPRAIRRRRSVTGSGDPPTTPSILPPPARPPDDGGDRPESSADALAPRWPPARRAGASEPTHTRRPDRRS